MVLAAPDVAVGRDQCGRADFDSGDGGKYAIATDVGPVSDQEDRSSGETIPGDDDAVAERSLFAGPLASSITLSSRDTIAKISSRMPQTRPARR
jgi:hypothetical protein